jgi:hypothetical protein
MATRFSEQEVNGVLEKCSNWGRWGKDDQRGALNFITDKKRAAAAMLVRSGETVSMALPLATIPAPDNPTPVMHLMQQTGFDAHEVELLPYVGDYFAIAPHGLANTHLDALCHVFHKGKMYNGFDAAEVGSHGAKKCAIDVAKEGVISRGVLLDIPKIKGVEWLENNVRITADDLDAAEKDHRVTVEEGDVFSYAPAARVSARPKAPGTPFRVDWRDSMRIACHGFINAKSQCSALTESAMRCQVDTRNWPCQFIAARWFTWECI